MKAQKFKLIIESDKKITTSDVLDLLQKHLQVTITSLAVVDWDTKEAEGIYSLE